MRLFGLIGFPLGHSFSRGYFNDKFFREGIDARYENFPLSSAGLVRSLVNENPALAGLNVTIPYKEAVISFLDETDSEASRIGAVNTIAISPDRRLKGYNTDVYGFRESLIPLLRTQHTHALVLGSGGASKAVRFTLEELGIEYRVVSRRPSDSHMISYSDLPRFLGSFMLIVNTSPVGMYPATDTSPDLPYDLIGPEHLAYDLVYNPETTLFMKKCGERGAKIKNGLEMLHLQAGEAWKIWNRE